MIYSLEMAAGSPAVRMENVLQRDLCGVYFYAACTSALDMLELNDDIMERLFEQLNVMKLFRLRIKYICRWNVHMLLILFLMELQ